jgi:uncharacterized membrane protein (DUF2068 family)
MASYTEGDAPRRAAASTGYDDYEEGYGWVMFAGIVIMIAGTLNIIYGIAAISNSHFYAANTHYVISDLNTWGWVIMLIGILQFCAAVGIWGKAAWARWVGVLVASVNAIIQLIFIPAYPFLALAIFTLDLLVVYGLVAYGGRERQGA